jgi:hypothetical protein
LLVRQVLAYIGIHYMVSDTEGGARRARSVLHGTPLEVGTMESRWGGGDWPRFKMSTNNEVRHLVLVPGKQAIPPSWQR